MQDLANTRIHVPFRGASISYTDADGVVYEKYFPESRMKGEALAAMMPDAVDIDLSNVRVEYLDLSKAKRKTAPPEVLFATGANPDFQPPQGVEAQLRKMESMIGGLVAKDKAKTERLKLLEAEKIAEQKAKEEAEKAAAEVVEPTPTPEPTPEPEPAPAPAE